MRWKQFFTPVTSISPAKAKELLDSHPQGEVTLLDVRQPKEYREAHLPAATLIPLAELRERSSELDPDKPTLVYCAIGGRSRVAAQMLAAADFSEVYNVSGGIKAWNGNTALGSVDQGLELFSGRESVEEVLVIAYGLEQGLLEFYQQMGRQVPPGGSRDLFERLASIEVHHMNRLLSEYNRVTGENITREDFTARIVSPALEGGITTEEYMSRFSPDYASPGEIVELAMSIESQALDLYHRASENTSDPDSRTALKQIAREEQEHISLLGELLDTL